MDSEEKLILLMGVVDIALIVAFVISWKRGPYKADPFTTHATYLINFPIWFFHRAFNTKAWRDYIYEKQVERAMELRQPANDPFMHPPNGDGTPMP